MCLHSDQNTNGFESVAKLMLKVQIYEQEN